MQSCLSKYDTYQTFEYNQATNQVRHRGQCLGLSENSQVRLHPCNSNDPNQKWEYAENGDIKHVLSETCRKLLLLSSKILTRFRQWNDANILYVNALCQSNPVPTITHTTHRIRPSAAVDWKWLHAVVAFEQNGRHTSLVVVPTWDTK